MTHHAPTAPPADDSTRSNKVSPAVIGTITTAGGALLRGLVTGAFDGTTRPISIGIVVFITLAAVMILIGTHGLPGTARHAAANDVS